MANDGLKRTLEDSTTPTSDNTTAFLAKGETVVYPSDGSQPAPAFIKNLTALLSAVTQTPTGDLTHNFIGKGPIESYPADGSDKKTISKTSLKDFLAATGKVLVSAIELAGSARTGIRFKRSESNRP